MLICSFSRQFLKLMGWVAPTGTVNIPGIFFASYHKILFSQQTSVIFFFLFKHHSYIVVHDWVSVLLCTPHFTHTDCPLPISPFSLPSPTACLCGRYFTPLSLVPFPFRHWITHRVGCWGLNLALLHSRQVP